MKELVWTAHARFKMKYYSLSESRVKRVLNRPDRVEEGIVENTIAMMQANRTSKKPYEIWIMLNSLPIKSSKLRANSLRVISAWNYPGRTKPGEPLPKEIAREIRE